MSQSSSRKPQRISLKSHMFFYNDTKNFYGAIRGVHKVNNDFDEALKDFYMPTTDFYKVAKGHV